VHRLVAQTFILNPLNKPQINHINGIKDDNRLENLEWCTGSENMIHALNIGIIKKGKDSTMYGKKGINAISSKKVIDTSNGIIYNSVKELAELININYSTLRCKLNGKNKNNTNFIYL
jgi:hypothetical protein